MASKKANIVSSVLLSVVDLSLAEWEVLLTALQDIQLVFAVKT